MNDFTARLNEMAREVAKDPGSPLYPQLALALADAGRYAQAVEICQRGLEVAPGAAGRRVLAQALLLLGRIDEARANAEALLEESEQDAVALRILGASFLARGDKDGARPFIERSARLDPSDMQTLDLLAQLAGHTEDGPEKTPSEHDLGSPASRPDAPSSPPSAPGEAREEPSEASFEAASTQEFELDLPGAEPEPAPPLPIEPDRESFSAAESGALEEPLAAPAREDDHIETRPDERDEGPCHAAQRSEEDPSSSWAGSWEAGEASDVLELDDGHEKMRPYELEPQEGEAGEPTGDKEREWESKGAGDALELDDGHDERSSGRLPPRTEGETLGLESDEDGLKAERDEDLSDSRQTFDAEPSLEDPGDRAPALGEETPSDGDDSRARKPILGTSGSVSPTPFWRQFQSLGSTSSSRMPTARLIAFFSKSPARKFGIPAAAAALILLLCTVFALSWKKGRDQEFFDEAMSLAAAAARLDTDKGYQSAIAHLEEALERKTNDPEALGLLAFSAARLHTAFEGGMEMAVLAEDYLAIAEAQPVFTPKGAAARGLLHLASGRPADAVSTAARSLGTHPGHPALLWVRAQAQLELQREDLALNALKEARANDPGFLPAANLLSKVLHSTGAKEKAHSIRLEIIAEHPSHIETLLALFEEASDGHVDPSALLESLLKSSGSWGSLSGETLCRLHLETAKVALLANRPSAATRAEDQALAAGPGSSCHARLGRHLLARQRPDEAFRCLLAVAEQGGDPEAKLDAARAALAAGRPDRVIDVLSPDGGGVEQALLAMALYISGRTQEALKTAESATGAVPADPETFATLAIISRSEGNLAAARQAARMSRVASPSPWQALATGLAYLELNEARRANAILNAAVRDHPSPSYPLLVAAARGATIAGRTPAALHFLERAITFNPEAEPALELYLSIAPTERATRHLASLCEPWGAALTGLAFASATETEKARKEHERSSSQGGGYWSELLGARVDALKGKADPATIRVLVRQHQERVMPRLLLAEVLLGFGRPAEAVEVLRDGLTRHPNHPRALVLLVEARAIIGTDPHAVINEAREVLRSVSAQALEDEMQGRLHGALALACATAGDARCARSSANRARRLAPRDGRTLFLVGRSLELLGDTRSARTTYSIAGRASGGEEALFRYALMSRGPDATRALQEFLARAANHALANQARQMLSASP